MATFGLMTSMPDSSNSAFAPTSVRFVNDDTLELLLTPIPGPKSLELAKVLFDFEAREVTYLSAEFPVFWSSAYGATITDADGNRYLDLTSAFGVAAIGHSNQRVIQAVVAQSAKLLHGMGDVHPTEVRARLLARLAALTPGRLSHGFLGLNGADAVEFARKTAMLVNGRPGTLSFEGSYHGHSYGALDVSGIDRFKAPFQKQLSQNTTIVPYPATGRIALDEAVANVRNALAQHPEIGMIIIEPLAGRAGTIVPVTGFLAALRQIADETQAVLVFDEIYTGFGRTGAWFACQHENVVPDIMCLGKALAGGIPLSAAIGTPEIMNAWPRSSGEALHTSTFLGNPLACAAALAVLDELEEHALPARAAQVGMHIEHALYAMAERLEPILKHDIDIRGRGMMWAIDLHDAELATLSVFEALRRGLIALQQGVAGTAIAITPPLTMSYVQIDRAFALLEAAIIEADKRMSQKTTA